jgi:hypothetical protein
MRAERFFHIILPCVTLCAAAPAGAADARLTPTIRVLYMRRSTILALLWILPQLVCWAGEEQTPSAITPGYGG